MIDTRAIVKRLTGCDLISPNEAKQVIEAIDRLIDQTRDKDIRILDIENELEEWKKTAAVYAAEIHTLRYDLANLKAQPGHATGVKDRNDTPIMLGDIVRYNIEGSHTKPEYWNPEYKVIFDAPCFTLKHVGGGKDGGNHNFKLKHGGKNGHLEIIKSATVAPVPQDAESDLAHYALDRERLALAICGGEDAPGYANAQTVETLEQIARDSTRDHFRTVDLANSLSKQLAETHSNMTEAYERAGQMQRRAEKAEADRDRLAMKLELTKPVYSRRKLIEKINEAKEALEFYADISKYPAPLTGGMGDLWLDCGSRAKNALASLRNEDDKSR